MFDEKIINFIKKHYDLIAYVFIGAVTTLINMAVYFILTRVFGIYYITADVISWVAAVVFAFFANKSIVFREKDYSRKKFLYQLASFFGLRIISLLLELLIMYIFVTLLYFNDALIKIAAAFIIVLTNYVFSKFIIFKK